MTAVAITSPPAARRRGRPTRYSAPLGKAICKMLAMGMTVAAIGRRPRMPAESVIRWWAAQPAHPFSAMYAHARAIGYDRMADEIIEISDDGTNDYTTRQTGKDGDGGTEKVVNHDHIARSRLRVDTRKWLMSKALPKVYGDRAGEEPPPPAVQVNQQNLVLQAGEDHLAGIGQRFLGGLKASVKTIEAKPVNGANGHANGANGHANGKTNGHANGKANGKTNGKNGKNGKH